MPSQGPSSGYPGGGYPGGGYTGPPPEGYPGQRRPLEIDAARLWAGGVATAIVAALLAAVGVFLVRGVLDIPILSSIDNGTVGDTDTITMAILAAAAALLATGVMHLLLLFAPSPWTFFYWIALLATVAAALGPFASGAQTSVKVATALIDVAIGLAITVLVSTMAHSATRPRPWQPPRTGPYQPPGPPPTQRY
ncbi:MAG: DUF6069 family protein [Frankiaceae bacterium]